MAQSRTARVDLNLFCTRIEATGEELDLMCRQRVEAFLKHVIAERCFQGEQVILALPGSIELLLGKFDGGLRQISRFDPVKQVVAFKNGLEGGFAIDGEAHEADFQAASDVVCAASRACTS